MNGQKVTRFISAKYTLITCFFFIDYVYIVEEFMSRVVNAPAFKESTFCLNPYRNGSFHVINLDSVTKPEFSRFHYLIKSEGSSMLRLLYYLSASSN